MDLIKREPHFGRLLLNKEYREAKWSSSWEGLGAKERWRTPSSCMLLAGGEKGVVKEREREREEEREEHSRKRAAT